MKKILLFVIVIIITVYSFNVKAKNIDIKLDAVYSSQKDTNLSNFIGQKPVLTIFFYPDCPPCEKESKVINEIYEKYKDSIFVVGISLSRDRYDIRDFIRNLNVKYPVYRINSKNQLRNVGGILATPTSIIIDKNGKISEKILGERKFQDLSDKIEKYVQ